MMRRFHDGWIRRHAARWVVPALVLGAAVAIGRPRAEEEAPPVGPVIPEEYVQVTGTRIPEDAETIPASVTIVTAQDLRNRGARDLRDALRLAVGLDIAPGGDGGPASFVPEIWGLREFDAFLLVVDGVPWGGAFTPALATISISDIERIEVVRGPAPVFYGATSFVGVIHLVRRAPGEGRPVVSAWAGSYGSGSVSYLSALPDLGKLKSSITADVGRAAYRDDRTQADRGHVLYRGALDALSGRIRLDADATWLEQDPASPTPRVGEELSPDVPLDANHNVDGAHLNERRIALSTGYDRPIGATLWSSTLSVSQSSQGIMRGFLTDVSTVAPNANGFRESIEQNDVYFDSHIEVPSLKNARIVAGVDYLYGLGRAHGGDFDYFVDLDGDHPPDGDAIPSASHVEISDKRNFGGLYANFELSPWERWRFDLGARLNVTDEERSTSSVEFGVSSTSGSDSRNVTRGSGAAAATFIAWKKKDDDLRIYAAYKNTFKPAVIDFGLDGEEEILEPETAVSYEGGLKGRFFEGRLDASLIGFQMDFENLVVSTIDAGVPALENVGSSRFRGLEATATWLVRKDLSWRTSYSLHDSRFRDYVQEFGGVPTQLKGNRQEMVARDMASTGVVWGRATGWVGSVDVNWVGSRFLNKRNTAKVPDYITWSGGVGYRGKSWEIRLDGTNINNQRPAVSESELGDAQYYRLTSRAVFLTGRIEL